MVEKKITQTEFDSDDKMHQVLRLVADMSEVLLSNGGEIFRVEETIQHVCTYFEIESVDAFIMSNGIFITAEDEKSQVYAKVKHIPLSASHLGIVTEVNSLSREITAGLVGLQEARERMAEIRKIPPKRGSYRVLAAGFGGACFCYLLRGNMWDSFMAFLISMFIYMLVILAEKLSLSRLIVNIAGGALITFIAIILSEAGLPFEVSRDKMIIGAIMPLIPGMAFMNAIRDIANSDYLSGTVRIIDSLLGFVYIAIGVGCVLSLYNELIGGLIK